MMIAFGPPRHHQVDQLLTWTKARTNPSLSAESFQCPGSRAERLFDERYGDVDVAQ
jgi:hypothetical protein